MILLHVDLIMVMSHHHVELEPGCSHSVVASKALSEDDIEQLKGVPGVYEAYKGAQNLSFKVCAVSGSDIIISPTALAEFSAAPPSVKADLEELVAHHGRSYAEMLKGRLTPLPHVAPAERGGGQVGMDDPRVDPTDETPLPSTVAEELPSIESEQALRTSHVITVDCKSFDEKKVILLISNKGDVFLCCKDWACKSALRKVTCASPDL